MTIKKSWRDDPGLILEVEYKKKFAWLPTKVSKNKIWLKTYYSKYHNWGCSYMSVRNSKEHYASCYHQDFVENISESEYLVRKLADNL